jgi:hypothetical protein
MLAPTSSETVCDCAICTMTSGRIVVYQMAWLNEQTYVYVGDAESIQFWVPGETLLKVLH